MANWSNPTLTSTYTNFVTEVKDRDVDLALQFDGTTSTNLTTGTIRWNSTLNRWQKWSGSAWGELATTYALTALSTTGTAVFGSTATATAFIPSSSAVPTTGLYLPAANTLGFATSSTDRLRIRSDGNIGVGGAGASGPTIQISKNATGSTQARGFETSQQIQTDVTSQYYSFSSVVTQIAGVTTGTISHFNAAQGTLSGTVASQYGFYANANLVGATNNYGFFSNIPVGTGNYNFYAAGTADNYMAGGLKIGAISRSAGALTVTNPATFYSDGATYTDNTTAASGTAAHGPINVFLASNIAATNTFVTYTNASTVYINGAPAGGTNVTITNAYALFIAAGRSNFPAGTAAAPLLCFGGDATAGFYRPTTDALGAATNGLERWRVDTNGMFTVGATNGTGNALSTTTTAAKLLVTGSHTDIVTAASGTVSAVTGFAIFNTSALNATNTGVTYTTVATVKINGAPSNGTNVTITNPFALQIAAGQTSIPVGTAALPSLTFGTNKNTGIWSPTTDTLAVSTGGTEAFRVTSAQKLLVGVTTATTSGGSIETKDSITFPSVAVASTNANTLDDYEEGTFTPTINGTGTVGTGTYSVQSGRYTRVGQRVYFQVHLTWSAHTGTTNMIIGALPFAAVNVGNAISAVSIRHSNLTSPASTVVQGFVLNNASTITLESVAVAGGAAAALAIDVAATLTVAGHYEAA